MGERGKEHLKDILNRQEYQAYYEDNRSIIERIIDWVIELFGKILEKIFPNLESTKEISGTIVTILVIIVVAVLAFILFRVYQRISYRRKYERTIPLEHLHEMEWTYQDHFQTAERREQSGKYYEAVRHLFLGLLLFYDRIEWLRAEIWKTNWEYYAELKKTEEKSAKIFNELARIFDEVMYGKREITPEEYEQYKALITKTYEDAQSRAEKEGE